MNNQTLAAQGFRGTQATVTDLSPESAAMARVTELAPARSIARLGIGDRITVLARRLLDAEVTEVATYCPPGAPRYHIIRWRAGDATGEFLRRDGETVTLAIDVEQVCREIADLTEQIFDLRLCDAAEINGTPFADSPDLSDAGRDIKGLEGKRDDLEELLSCLALMFAAPAAPVLKVAA